MTAVDTAWLGTREYIDDPYPFYRQLRDASPVHWVEELNAWMLTRYADVHLVHNDGRFVAGYEQLQITRVGPEVADREYFRFAREFLITSDGAAHARLRRIFRQPFTPKRVAQARAANQLLIDRSIDAFVELGEGDIIGDFALPVPLQMVSSLLGVPIEDESEIRSWLLAFGDARGVERMSHAQLAALDDNARKANGYFVDLVRARRARPCEDFISELLAANSQDPEPLSDDQLAANLFLLYFAGHHTQSLQFGNIVVALVQHPQALQQLRDDLARVPDCMGELYRFDAAGQFDSRTLLTDVELGGRLLRAGQIVLAGVGAANRDPDAFVEPDRLDLRRDDAQRGSARALTFGSGHHYCIGVHMAQANLAAMLQSLLSRLADVDVEVQAANRVVHPQARGFTSLPMRWNVAASLGRVGSDGAECA